MTVRVQTGDFDIGEEIARLRADDRGVGAIASFIGTVRDVNDASTITGMTLEHYPGMTEAALGHPRRTRHPSGRRAGARRSDRAGRRHERAPRCRVRRVSIPHGLAEDA